MKVYAIIPARSGSKGYKNKNIQLIDNKPLIAYSINFAKQLNCDKIICSTDSEEYKEIAEHYGAEVPFLRSPEAAADTAMEEDILKDMYQKFIKYNIEIPDILVWLRPTFVFRDKNIINQAIEILKNNPSTTSVRTICESELRLYSLDENNGLFPRFDDKGKSMIRRQDVGIAYKVFSTDVFRFTKDNLNDVFLGTEIVGLPINKICGLDIDDEIDFKLVKTLIESKCEIINDYVY